MFRIKICGITTVDDALTAARAGADAIGLNFFPESPRYLPHEHARRIVQEVPAGIVKVGLFVNSPVEEVRRTFDLLRLDLIQLHGDESPEFLSELEGRPAMRAFRLAGSDLKPIAEYLGTCRRLKCMPRLTLLDTFCKGRYGGTGQTADWTVAARYCEEVGKELGHASRGRPDAPHPFSSLDKLEVNHVPPLVLAGGLTPDNVAEAIRTVRPTAVDTASGVESAPGHKDPALVAEFVREAKAAFAVGR
jgi:phosphoribosylanthranilate isomerase